MSWDYNDAYGSIPGELIGYVGDDNTRSSVGIGFNPNSNLQAFIEDFSLTAEEIRRRSPKAEIQSTFTA